MVQGISFSNFQVGFGKNVRAKQGNPPEEFKNELKQAGIPDDVIAQGRSAVEAYAKKNNITLPNPPKPPEHPASQGAEHANENSALNKATSTEIKNLMDQNQIISTGLLKDDIATIKAAIKALDKDSAKVLADKFKEIGLSFENENKNIKTENCCKGTDQMAALNKHFLMNKHSKKVAS